ncbi:MAG: hypothetical protein ACI92G_003823 [Candidatus Pelagisphaera sp.]
MINIADNLEMENHKTEGLKWTCDKAAWRYYARSYRGKLEKALTVLAFSIVQSMAVSPVVLLDNKIVETATPNSDTRTNLQLIINGLAKVVFGWPSGLNFGTNSVFLCANRVDELFDCDRMLGECRVSVEEMLNQSKLSGVQLI